MDGKHESIVNLSVFADDSILGGAGACYQSSEVRIDWQLTDQLNGLERVPPTEVILSTIDNEEIYSGCDLSIALVTQCGEGSPSVPPL